MIECGLLKLGIILNTNDAETAWNAMRFGTTALLSGHKVKMFLLGKGVEITDVQDSKFNIQEQINLFLGRAGEILACGTCLRLRNKKSIDVCPVSSMSDMLKIVEESDKVMTFG